MTIPADVLLPEGTRLVHIGPQKTGTTTLQTAFHAARRELLRQGVFYASTNRQAKQAARAVVGARSPYAGGEVTSGSHWQRLVRDVNASTAPRVVISTEAFADAWPATVDKIVDGFDRSRVHVVATVRPIARIMPSQWQQYVQNGLTAKYEPWLRSIFEDPPEKMLTPSFWHRHRHDRLVLRWAEKVGIEHVTVVVVDDKVRDSALRAFELLLGLRDGTLVAHESLANRSLTRAEVELVRAMNLATRNEDIDPGVRLNAVLHGAAANMKLREPARGEPKIETPPWAAERAAVAAREIVDGLKASGVRVVGDLETLAPPGSDKASEQRVAAEPGAGQSGAGQSGAGQSGAGNAGSATAPPWPVIESRALMGVLAQTGFLRGGRASVGSAWPDDLALDAAGVGSSIPTVSWEAWSTPRIASLVIGRARWAVRARVRGVARLLRLLRRRTPGGRARDPGRKARRRERRIRRARPVNASVHSAQMQAMRRGRTEAEVPGPK